LHGGDSDLNASALQDYAKTTYQKINIYTYQKDYAKTKVLHFFFP